MANYMYNFLLLYFNTINEKHVVGDNKQHYLIRKF